MKALIVAIAIAVVAEVAAVVAFALCVQFSTNAPLPAVFSGVSVLGIGAVIVLIANANRRISKQAA